MLIEAPLPIEDEYQQLKQNRKLGVQIEYWDKANNYVLPTLIIPLKDLENGPDNSLRAKNYSLGMTSEYIRFTGNSEGITYNFFHTF
jgi:hypothetical protein